MHTLEQALEKLLGAIEPISGCERLSVNEVAGRILAEPVVASHSLPVFDNSAMDGWAVRSADVSAASPDHPVLLRPIANIPAGQFFPGEVRAGECARIFTGSPLPAGADAVVMQEDTRPSGAGEVMVVDAVKAWENIRFRAEDVKEGSRVGKIGTRITPPMAALFSACGVAKVSVKRTLRVALLATGNELREPAEPISTGEIHESNRVMIASFLRRIGIEPVVFPIVRDELESTVQALREAAATDAVISCGGVSVGEHDYVKPAIEKLGGTLDFWRVAIKPGKPFLHASIAGRHLFGLPGNPVSALVTFFLLVRPALLRMSGLADVASLASFGELAEAISNPGDRRHFMRVRLEPDGRIQSTGPQASHRLASLAGANALLDIPPGANWEKGAKVRILLLDY